MFSSPKEMEDLRSIDYSIDSLKIRLHYIESLANAKLEKVEKRLNMMIRYRPSSIIDQFRKDSWTYRKPEIVKIESKLNENRNFWRNITTIAIPVNLFTVYAINRFIENRIPSQHTNAIDITSAVFSIGAVLFGAYKLKNYHSAHERIVNHMEYLLYDSAPEKIKKEKTDQILDD